MSKTLGQRLADFNIEVGTAMTIDWQQVRIQAAIAAMQAHICDEEFMSRISRNLKQDDNEIVKFVVKWSVTYADALVAELKHSDDVYAECRRMDAINTAAMCENMTKIQKELQKKGGKQ